MPPRLSSATTLKRIHREVADLKKEDLGSIVLAPSDDNIYLWKGSIPGPEGSVYEGGIFNFEVSLPTDYPIYHMNISDQGGICIDILKHNWSPALSLFKVMLSLSSLLTDPNPSDPLVPSIATQYVRNRKQHDDMARQWTQTYALPKPPPAEPAVSSKSKGKQKATPSASRAATTSATAAASEPITIEDSDDEDSRASAKRRSVKRKRDTVQSEVISLDDGDEVEISDGATSSKKRAVGNGRTPRVSLDAAGSGGSVPPTQLGDVIVIEDDDD
ncbi:hypothetical protein H0H81_004895 [Sphagnurus paluster]|uniref:UBC core domain-containing protein n=1 Tax=Sphagnurus paluster TaxID=117069 RepID=A0A9P7FUM0_9AGAR|nr:hypothetical protein H0H81_004895 [Sphagnurus paluster]